MRLASSSPETTDLIPLDDTQVRRFITDGYLILRAEVPAAVHEAIYHKIGQALNEEGNPGNNILPAVPELQRILDDPTIRGALTGVLGPNYLLHPHRYVHNNEPGKITAEGAQMGKGSHNFIGWHQDDHSPLARPRHHVPRYAMILYYPQDTPIAMGPTQIIPATHLHRSLSSADTERGFQASGPAGTCVLVRFDLAHGGSLNIADRTRYMAKFVFARTEEPELPSWDCRADEWITPAGSQSPYNSPVVWSHLWEWLCGRGMQRRRVPDIVRPDREQVPELISALESAGTPAARVEAINRLAALGEDAAPAVTALIAAMGGEEAVRQNAIYALAAIGEPAVTALCRDLAQRETDGWNEGAVVMESSAYALAAIGRPAIAALTDLLSHSNDWVRVNAAFALGEMGTQARPAVPALVSALGSLSHPLVRTALDALGQIGPDEGEALSMIRRLLAESRPEWQARLRRDWSGENQVRMNAMMALLRLGWRSEETIETIAAALGDPCGYVTGLGIEALLRQDTPSSLRHALNSLRAHRWDESLRKGVRTY